MAVMRRKTGRLGKVTRDRNGNTTMIQFEPYKDNPLAPTALVSKVGGIYRIDSQILRVTFIDHIPNSEGDLQAVAQGHLLWKTAQDWLATREIFEFAMTQFRRGVFREGVHRTQ